MLQYDSYAKVTRGIFLSEYSLRHHVTEAILRNKCSFPNFDLAPRNIALRHPELYTRPTVPKMNQILGSSDLAAPCGRESGHEVTPGAGCDELPLLAEVKEFGIMLHTYVSAVWIES